MLTFQRGVAVPNVPAFLAGAVLAALARLGLGSARRDDLIVFEP